MDRIFLSDTNDFDTTSSNQDDHEFDHEFDRFDYNSSMDYGYETYLDYINDHPYISPEEHFDQDNVPEDPDEFIDD